MASEVSRVRASALRRRALSLAKAFSIGLKSGSRAQVSQRRALAFDSVADRSILVGGQVVHDDDIPDSRVGTSSCST